MRADHTLLSRFCIHGRIAKVMRSVSQSGITLSTIPEGIHPRRVPEDTMSR